VRGESGGAEETVLTMRRGIGALLDRFGRTTVIAVAVGLVVVVGAAVTVYRVFFDQDTYRITARFTATPGLYPGNRVAVLGVPSGEIVSIKPTAKYVDVVLSLPTSVKVPVGAKAVLMAPNPVSDRFVELTPAYTKGAALKGGAVLGLSDTAVPLELDSIYASVDNLAKSLGPAGANAHGELSDVLHSFAQLADGNGADLHATIDRIAAALPALTAHPDDLKNLITGLDQLTSKLAAHDATINALYDDLSGATGQLADERDTIAAAVSNLQVGLAEVAGFLRTNRAHLGSSVKNLDVTIAAVMSEQKALIQTFDTAPLGFQNFNRAIDPNAPCLTPTGAPNNCTALWGRLNPTANGADIVKTYCGQIPDSLLPIILANLKLATATATDTACGAEVGLLQNRSGPPGVPKTPDLDLTHQLGSR
jgi:phospholipid/cholesterol/gamma-HCH transport system substrate-binding protein